MITAASAAVVASLTDRLVDDAGLFPPAQLSMDEALATNARCRAGSDGSIVGNFVVPASRLDELANANGARPLALSVILDGDLDRALAAVDAFVFVKIAALETPPDLDLTQGKALERLEAWARSDPMRRPIYCELVNAATPLGHVASAVGLMASARLARENFGVKIRTGGIVPTAFPSVELLAEAIARCAHADVPFKATAGLHHAMRRTESGAAMHGFLNLLIAAAIAHRDPDERDAIVAALSEDDAGAFVLDEDHLTWGDRRFGAATLRAMRLDLFAAFGSCSLTEPAEELRALGLRA